MTAPVKLAGSPVEKEAVADAIYRFTLSLDTRDLELFDSSFTEDGGIELLGERATGKQELPTLTAIAYAQHFGKGKGLVEGTKFLLSGGVYRAELIKDTTDDIWRNKDLVIDLHWTDGDMAVFQDK
ncbi:hypothetical protein KL938_004413 [Ogataea parapolymorpha]|nr:hypothetical protein KL938_004413 [Ogataea parapolymorpha]